MQWEAEEIEMIKRKKTYIDNKYFLNGFYFLVKNEKKNERSVKYLYFERKYGLCYYYYIYLLIHYYYIVN
jgi:hypothetical protein